MSHARGQAQWITFATSKNGKSRRIFGGASWLKNWTCLIQELDSAIADRRRQMINVQMCAILFERWDMARTNEEEMKAIDSLMSPLVVVAGKMGCQIGNVSLTRCA